MEEEQTVLPVTVQAWVTASYPVTWFRSGSLELDMSGVQNGPTSKAEEESKVR